MNLQSQIPSLVAGVVVGGIALASGGNGLQAGVSAIATGGAGATASTLGIQSQKRREWEIEQQCKTLKQELQTYKQKLPLVSELEDLQRQQEQLQQTIETLKQEETGFQARVSKVRQNLPNLEELEQRQQKLGELQAHLNHHQGELSAIQAQIQEREAQRDRLQEVTAQFLQKQSEVESLRERLQDLNQQAAELELFRSTYDALRVDAQQLEAKKQHFDAEIPRLNQEHDRILAEIANQEDRARQVDALRIQIENLEAEIRNQQSILNSLRRQVIQLTSEKNNLEDEISRKTQEINRLTRQLREIQEEIRQAKEEREEVQSGIKQAFKGLEEPITVEATQPCTTLSSEIEFLTAFKQYLGKKGLVFPERVIHAFHTSLKVQDISALVILAGISGTGKSELPRAYAKFIGAPLVMLPVQPRWDSPQDLQGFYNYIEKKYKPTKLMHYLYQHERSNVLWGRIVLVLLDEMNLARVEYYFSDFLSKLESRRSTKTYLELDAGSEEERRVIIPDEFLFVGTMNEDETTQSLSDKVLDRANVLTFGRPPELKLQGGQHSNPPDPTEYISWDVFQSWTKEPIANPNVSETVKDYVDRANDIMESLGRPFAHRVFQAFAKYVVNYPNPNRDEIILKQAIADQFGQKLLPKLRGLMVEETNVKSDLDRLESLLSELEDQALNDAFAKAREGQYGQFQWKGMVYS